MFIYCEKPQHWYQREVVIRIPIWPKWLAQWSCEHERKRIIIWGNDNTATYLCEDCYKTFTIPTTCKHPYEGWKITSVELQDTAEGGGKDAVPSTWECGDCGYPFTKDMQCPNCHTDMEITEWMGMFSGRFRCPTCGEYHFREDLQ